MPELEIELRGAPWDLLTRLYGAPPFTTEILIDGAAGTGKSWGVCAALYSLTQNFPGIRVLVCRKTRRSLTDSFCPTWEATIPDGDECLQGPKPEGRHSYNWSSGSTLVLAGLDEPTRHYSSSWDVVYCEEAGELSEDEWERWLRSLRPIGAPRTPWKLLLGCTNPYGPRHWLNQRCLQGRTLRLKSHHEDNPLLHDGTDWTPEGRQYIAILDALTGVRKERLRFGRWVSAEGVIWENYSEDTYHCDMPQELPRGESLYVQRDWGSLGIRRFFASVDWGFANPGCMAVFGVTGDRRLYRVAEIYRRGEQIDWWAERAVEFREEFGIFKMVCDQSRPDAIDLFNKRLGSLGGRDESKFAVGVHNRKQKQLGEISSLDVVREYLTVRPDRLPGLLFCRDALRHRDEGLVDAKLPWISEHEFEEYVYRKTEDDRVLEEPDPACVDHGCDVVMQACWFANGIDPLSGVQRIPYSPHSLGAMLRHDDIFKRGEDQTPRGPGPLLPRTRRTK